MKSLINVLVVLGLISAPLFANEPTAAAPTAETHPDAAAAAHPGKVAKKAKKATKETKKTTTTEHTETAPAPAGEAHPTGN